MRAYQAEVNKKLRLIQPSAIFTLAGFSLAALSAGADFFFLKRAVAPAMIKSFYDCNNRWAPFLAHHAVLTPARSAKSMLVPSQTGAMLAHTISGIVPEDDSIPVSDQLMEKLKQV
jgi:hypothetical protein